MEFLSFSLGGLEYGLEFDKVQELRLLESMERVDGMAVPRGVIMPIVDMRFAVEGGAAASGAVTDVIILQLNNCMMGLVVDDVKGVVTLQPDEISPAPGNDYLIGLGESDGRRLVLVDIDKLMAIQPSSQRKLGSMLSIQHR